MKAISARLRDPGVTGICIIAPLAPASTLQALAGTVTVKSASRSGAPLGRPAAPGGSAAVVGVTPAGLADGADEVPVVGDRIQIVGTIGATRDLLSFEIARGVGSIMLDRFVKVLGARTAIFRLLDSFGREVAAQTLRPNQHGLELFTGLAAGSYLLDINGLRLRQPLSLSTYELSMIVTL